MHSFSAWLEEHTLTFLLRQVLHPWDLQGAPGMMRVTLAAGGVQRSKSERAELKSIRVVIAETGDHFPIGNSPWTCPSAAKYAAEDTKYSAIIPSVDNSSKRLITRSAYFRILTAVTSYQRASIGPPSTILHLLHESHCTMPVYFPFSHCRSSVTTST